MRWLNDPCLSRQRDLIATIGDLLLLTDYYSSTYITFG
jgi:hypothetical protein